MEEASDDVLLMTRELRLAVGRLSRAIRRVFADEQEGLAFLELGVLDRLDRCGPASPGTLSGGEGVTSPAIAATLRHLEELGLIERSKDPQDGRRIVAAITENGRRSLAQRDTAVLGRLRQILLDHLTDAERADLRAAVPLLEKVAENL